MNNNENFNGYLITGNYLIELVDESLKETNILFVHCEILFKTHAFCFMQK